MNTLEEAETESFRHLSSTSCPRDHSSCKALPLLWLLMLLTLPKVSRAELSKSKPEIALVGST